MKSRLEKAMDYIKGYCEKNTNCNSCKLRDSKTEECLTKYVAPIDWEKPKRGTE